MQQLQESLLKRLEEKGLTVSKRKSQLKLPEVKFFGLILSKDGVRVSDDKVKALREALPPKNASEAAGILGHAAFCSRHIPNLASIVKPIRNLTKKGLPLNGIVANKMR